jgi:YfiH family protein
LPAEPFWLSQVHGTVVADISLAPAAEAGQPGQLIPMAPEADASIAHTAGAVCTIMTADCLPVLFCDTAGAVVGAAHAGWRGLAGGVLARTLDAMRAAGAGQIMAWLGPAIGPSRFEVGADVLAAFEAGAQDDAAMAEVTAAFRAIDGSPGKYLADIYALARSVLRRDGVGSIAGGEFCTVSEPDRFYSYRRDKVTGRQASLIWIK